MDRWSKYAMKIPPNTGWLTRIAVALLTVVLVILGFFFLTVALIAGALVAIVFGARLWWTLRKLKRAQAQSKVAAEANVVEGNYRVIEHESTTPRLPPQQ